MSSQFSRTSSALSTSTSPKTCGCRWTSLSWTRGQRRRGRTRRPRRRAGRERRSGTRDRRAPLGDARRGGARPGLSAASSARGRRGPRSTPPQVRHQRGVGLSPVPGTALPQRVHQRNEAWPPRAPPRQRPGRAVGCREVDGGEVVGFDRAIELPPVDRDHHLVGQPEVVQDHRLWWLHRRVLECKLDVGEDEPGPALGHEQRASAHCGVADRAGVHHPDTLGHRVDPERRPGHVDERQRRHDREVDPLVGAQQLDGALRDEGRPGTAYTTDSGARAVAASTSSSTMAV